MGDSTAAEADVARLIRPSVPVIRTPKAEVDLTCRLALGDLLAHRVPGSEPWLSTLVLRRRAPAELMRRRDWLAVQSILSSLRIIDPACGEGDFLLGMLDVLTELQTACDAHLDTPTDSAVRRQHIVAQNLYGVEVQRKALALARARMVAPGATSDAAREQLAWGDSLVPRPPFGWESNFGHVLKVGGFDLVIGNPPYLRHERIDDPLALLENRQYKRLVIRHVMDRLTQRRAAETGFLGSLPMPSRRSDLSSLFSVMSLSLVKPCGVVALVLPAAVFEARYGVSLIEHTQALRRDVLILESNDHRSFHHGVNAVIFLASPRSDSTTISPRVSRQSMPGRLETAGFLKWKDPHRRGRGDAQRRWDSVRDLNRIRGLSVLRAIGHVRYALKTGINGFFFVRAEAISTFGIERQFCIPVLKSPRDVRCIRLHAGDVRGRAFLCNESLEELEATGCDGALRYISWGAQQRTRAGVPWPQAPSMRGRRPWYSLPSPPTADILCPRFFNERFLFPLPAEAILADQTFYSLALHARDDESRLVACAILNSSLSYWIVELLGRSGLGEGVRQYALCDMQMLPILDPLILSTDVRAELSRILFSLARRPVLPIAEEIEQADRRALDELIGPPAGLSTQDLDAIRSSLVERVERRLHRAANRPASEESRCAGLG